MFLFHNPAMRYVLCSSLSVLFRLLGFTVDSVTFSLFSLRLGKKAVAIRGTLRLQEVQMSESVGGCVMEVKLAFVHRIETSQTPDDDTISAGVSYPRLADYNCLNLHC